MNKILSYYKEQVEDLMHTCIDARMTIYFLEAIRSAAKNDERLDLWDFSDLSTFILGTIDQMYGCNPNLHYIIHSDKEVLA